jgi:hypothetical protein
LRARGVPFEYFVFNYTIIKIGIRMKYKE